MIRQDETLTVQFRWRVLGLVALDGDRPAFPKAPEAPGLYRFWFDLDGHRRVYVGEDANLRRRFNGYRNPGPTQQTNLRMLPRIQAVLHGGGAVRVDICDAVEVLAGPDRVASDLGSPFVRRLAENASLVVAVAAGLDVVNGPGYNRIEGPIP